MRLGEGSAVAQILKIIRSEIWNIRKQRRIRNVCLSPVSWKSARSFVACLLADVAQQWFLTPLLNLPNFVFLLSFSSLFWFLSLCFFECLYIVDVGTSNLWKKSHQLTISFDSRLFFVSLWSSSPQKLVVFALLELTHLPSVCWKRKNSALLAKTVQLINLERFSFPVSCGGLLS